MTQIEYLKLDVTYAFEICSAFSDSHSEDSFMEMVDIDSFWLKTNGMPR